MHARVVRWEGAEAEAMRASLAAIKEQSSAGPPEGVPAKGFMFLVDPDNGRGLAVTLFETEEDMQKGHEVLSAMNPPGDGMGRRTSVEMYEVGLEVRV